MKQDEWEATSEHTCLRECACPEDGSACSLREGCKAQSFACRDGYRRFSTGDVKCYPVGCQEGSLKVESSLQEIAYPCTAQLPSLLRAC